MLSIRNYTITTSIYFVAKYISYTITNKKDWHSIKLFSNNMLQRDPWSSSQAATLKVSFTFLFDGNSEKYCKFN